MKEQREKIIVILGPTATGKSDMAVAIAREIGGEIVSADSRQVYRGLDVGSGKITKREMKGVPHHLLDVADPKDRRYTAADFASDAKSAARAIFSHGKTPIIAGGTGFYIEAFLHDGNFPAVLPNKKLRIELGKLGAEVLLTKLRRLDPVRAKNIDPKNKIRIIRAIEIATALGKVPERKKTSSKYEVLNIGLTLSREELREKIHKRLVKRMRNDALIKEVQKLHRHGVSWKRLHDFGLEYRYVALYLQKKMTRKKMLADLETAINQYAKRQVTWFKRDKNIKWFKPSNTQKIKKEVREFIK